MAGKAKRPLSKEEKKLIAETQEKISPKQMLDVIKKAEIKVEIVDGKPTTMNSENLEKFVKGELTWAQLQGLSMEQVYGIADFGYKLFEQGKYDDARQIFQGLVVMNPYDGYFHSVLGSIYARQGKDDLAVLYYSFAANTEPAIIEVFVNRAEILLKHGFFEQAMADLKRTTELDPKNENPATIRARALASATAALLAEALKKQKAAGSKKK